jgi:hypothetical protein
MASSSAKALPISSSHSPHESPAKDNMEEKSSTTASFGNASPAPNEALQEPQEHEKDEVSEKKSFGFYMIMSSLSMITLFASIDATIIVTAFPTISRELHGGDKYVGI